MARTNTKSIDHTDRTNPGGTRKAARISTPEEAGRLAGIVLYAVETCRTDKHLVGIIQDAAPSLGTGDGGDLGRWAAKVDKDAAATLATLQTARDESLATLAGKKDAHDEAKGLVQPTRDAFATLDAAREDAEMNPDASKADYVAAVAAAEPARLAYVSADQAMKKAETEHKKAERDAGAARSALTNARQSLQTLAAAAGALRDVLGFMKHTDTQTVPVPMMNSDGTENQEAISLDFVKRKLRGESLDTHAARFATMAETLKR